MWKRSMKKGFTLIELVVTMGLIALFGILIANNFTGLFSKEQDAEYNRFKTNLENAACAYLDLSAGASYKSVCLSTGTTKIRVSMLLGTGLIKEKDMINPSTKTSISSSKEITVTCNSTSGRTCKYE